MTMVDAEAGYQDELLDNDTRRPTAPAERRATNAARVVDALRERGYTLATGSERIFGSADLPNRRWVVNETNVRQERRDAGKWRLHTSYLLTTQADDVIAKLAE
jgi:hypothetical protein